MSHEHGGNLLSNASSRIHTRTCLHAKSLSYPIAPAKEEAACTALVPLVFIKVISFARLRSNPSLHPPPSSARYSQRVAAASRFVNISWGWRSGKTDLTAHIKEGGGREAKPSSLEKESKLFPDFSWISNKLAEQKFARGYTGGDSNSILSPPFLPLCLLRNKSWDESRVIFSTEFGKLYFYL